MPPIVTSSGSRAGSYQNPANRFFSITVAIDEGIWPRLPEEMYAHFTEALIFHFKDAAERVIETVRSYLVRLDEAPVKNSLEGIGIHGLDTGAMSAGLQSALAEDMADLGVFYAIFDSEPYWTFVEFGHWTRSGNFWPGYHMIETALQENAGYIRQAAREAWSDTAMALAMQARIPGAMGLIGLNIP